ncbi:hypothetical protein BHM03_00041799 [Ensete ventricosum]|nr:hypothetical protein BHM03_00041799 [Ensete ventricosum]
MRLERRCGFLNSPVRAFTDLLQFLEAIDAARPPGGGLLEIQLTRSGHGHCPPPVQETPEEKGETGFLPSLEEVGISRSGKPNNGWKSWR